MSLLKSTLWLVLAEIVFTLSGYIINAGLGRLLGPSDYGRYSIVIGFTTMIIIFVGRSIPTAMAKRLSENTNNPSTVRAITRTAAIIQTIVIVVLTSIFYLSAPLIARGLGDVSLTEFFRLSALIIPAFSLSSFHVLFFNGLKHFGAMTALKMSRGIFRMLWILGLAYYYGVTGALTGAIIAPLCVFGIALVIDAFFLPHGSTTSTSAKKYSKLFSYPPSKILYYAGGFMLFTFFYEFYVRTDIYLIKILVGNDYTTGLYAAAMTVALIPYYLFFAVSFMLFPTISERTKSHGNSGATEIVTTVLRFVFIFLLPVSVLMGFFAEPLVTLFFGSAFSQSASLVPLMVGGTIFGTIFYILAAVFNGAGYTRITATITALAIIISIVVNIIYVPKYGITITALTFSGTSFFMGITSLIAARHIFAAHIPLMTIIRVVILTFFIGCGAFLLVQTGLFFVISSVLLLGTYCLLLIVSGELTQDDITHLKSARKK